MEKIRLGISACLLGEEVRYDGGQRREDFLADTLARWVEYVPVCPEHECGLSVPREAMHLVGDPDAPRLVTIRTGVDHTARMTSWARRRLRQLEEDDLSGFIFKSKSPSCGAFRVKVFDDRGRPRRVGRGLWASAFVEHAPTLPVEEEGRLRDPGLRESFFERLFVMRRWRALCSGRRSLGRLADFHARHEMLVLAHSPKHLRRLSAIVDAGRGVPVAKLHDDYLSVLREALVLRATPTKHAKVLRHAMRHLEESLSADETQELLFVIDAFGSGDVPLIVPLTLLRSFARMNDRLDLASQHYLSPHPAELGLKNHA